MGKRRRSPDQWGQLIREFEASGQSAQVFCSERNLNQAYFFQKRRRLARAAPAFVAVRAQMEPAPVTVQIADVTVRCSIQIPPAWIAELAIHLRS